MAVLCKKLKYFLKINEEVLNEATRRTKMTTEWVFSFGKDANFISSSERGIWGFENNGTNYKHFIEHVKPGDRLWFKSKGQVIAVATYIMMRQRQNGPLVNMDFTNSDLGWTGSEVEGTHLVFYDNLYDLRHADLRPSIVGAAPVRRYNYKGEGINLSTEYPHILRYMKPSKKM